MNRLAACLTSICLLISCSGEGSDANGEGVRRLTAAVTAAPTISAFTPKAVQGATININGSNFVQGATVAFSGAAATDVTFVRGSRLQVVVPPFATSGPIQVTTPFGTATSATDFLVLPTVPAYSPESGYVGDTVTLTGGGYTDVTAVHFGTIAAAFTLVNDARIDALVPAGAANGKILVWTPQGGATTVSAFRTLPEIVGFSPTFGVAGDTVTISGAGFAIATSVKFGITPATCTVQSDEEIVCTVPEDARLGKITVETPRGNRTTSANFMILKRPSITSVTPLESALPAELRITGNNLYGISGVQVGGVSITPFTLEPGVAVTLTLPLGTPSGFVTVTNAAGTGKSAEPFTAIDRCAGVACVAADACHLAGVCDPLTGQCSQPVAEDGTPCTDGDACTGTDQCVGGVCVGSEPVCAPADPDAAIAAGAAFTCALVGGKVYCWGENRGTLGDGTYQSSLSPVEVVGISDAIAIGAGDWHTCALLASGEVRCWGENWLGQLGDGQPGVASPIPVAVAGIADAVQLSVGAVHSCAIRASGAGVCWGWGSTGALGDGLGADSAVPVTVADLSDLTFITAGYRSSCARRQNGDVYCWGNGSYAPLGDGSFSDSLVPIAIPDLNGATSISLDSENACATRPSGHVVCWGGNNVFGQIGDGSTMPSAVPVPVIGIDDAVTVQIRALHACARRRTGELACWGYNYYGTLGDGTFVNAFTPVSVLGVSDATGLGMGPGHSCALRATGQPVCWGYGSAGQLGNGHTAIAATPVRVESAADFTTISLGSSYACGVHLDGTAACWGNLGYPGFVETERAVTTPVEIAGLEGARLFGDACVLRGEGEVWCWGQNYYGQLGIGSTDPPPSLPARVPDLADIVAVSQGEAHVCAVRATGQVLCWGRNMSGELGSGPSGPLRYSASPIPVPGISDAISVSAGAGTSCAVRATGQVLCWGSNRSGQLGDGTFFDSETPVAVTGLSDAIAVSKSWGHTCALRLGGQVSCWGAGAAGELGDGGTTLQRTPVEVAGLSDAVEIGVGNQYTCARRANGQVQCWGSGIYGQLGNGGYSDASIPVTVAGISGATSLSLGAGSACAVLESGEARCWGEGYFGQLGDGTPYWPTPVAVMGLP